MPRDPAEVFNEDRIRLTHMVEAARRVQRIYEFQGAGDQGARSLTLRVSYESGKIGCL